MKSQAMAISVPPPSAKPFTAAIVGFGMSSRSLVTSWPSWANRTPSAASLSFISAMSAPAMNALSPSPVRMTARTAGSFAASVSAIFSSRRVSVLSELRAFGLEIFTIRMPGSAFSTTMLLSAVITMKPPTRFPPQPARGDILFQKRARAVLAVAQSVVEHVHDGQAGVEPDEVGKLERAHGLVRPELHRDVDVGGRRDAF